MKALVKTVEFIVVAGLTALGAVLGKVEWLWVGVIVGGYLLVNLMGWATKSIGGETPPDDDERTIGGETPSDDDEGKSKRRNKKRS